MTVYLDDWRQPAEVRGRADRWSHLVGDDREELHEFATRFGVGRRAFQDHAWRWHYDVPERLRPAVIGAGASAIGWRDLGYMLRARRRSIDDPPPAAGVLVVTGAAPLDPFAVGRVLAMRLGAAYAGAEPDEPAEPAGARALRGANGVVHASRAAPEPTGAVEVIELSAPGGVLEVVEGIVGRLRRRADRPR